MQRFEFNDDTSSKFWEIEQQDCDINVRFGKIGTAGQSQVKSHPDAAKAAAALAKLIKEKTGKGYVASGAAAPVTPAAAHAIKVAPATAPRAPQAVALPPVVSPPPVAAHAPVLAGDVPPWEAAGPLLDVPPPLAALALPSRRLPGTPRAIDAQACWNLSLKMARERVRVLVDRMDAPFKEAAQETAKRLENGTQEGSLESDAMLLGVEVQYEGWLRPTQGAPIVDFLVATKGLPYALEVLLTFQQWGMNYGGYYTSPMRELSFSTGESRYHGMPIFSAAELAYRTHLAAADDATWQQCVARIQGAMESVPPARQPLLCLLLPDFPEMSNELARCAKNYDHALSWLLLTATAPDVIERLRRFQDDRTLFYGWLPATMTLVMERGVDAVDILKDVAFADASAKALACIGTPAALTALAKACDSNRESLARFATVVQRWPLAAIAALSELIALDGKGPVSAGPVLATLAYANAGSLPAFRPWISPAAAQVLDAVVATFGAPLEMADAADLPRVLAAPPWKLAPKKAPPALLLEALPLAPVERWDAGERAAILATFSDRWGYSLTQVLANPRAMAEAVGIDDPPYSTRAAAAIVAMDSTLFIAAYADYLAAGGRPGVQGTYVAKLPESMAADVWNATAGGEMRAPHIAVATFGLRGLVGVARLCSERPAAHLPLALHFGAVELAEPVARALATMKARDTRAVARKWLLTNPEHAACALIAPALGKAGPARTSAGGALRLLAAAGHADLLMDVAARYGQASATAAMRAMLDEDRLDLFPPKIAKLPDFWQPLSWTRPVLKSNGKAIPDGALDDLGIMLRFPSADVVYAGIGQLKEACTPTSLALFAWDAFFAWMYAGGDAKDNWAFTALGLIGNDDSARKLTPFIRAWPGEGQHVRAVTGLDVLAMIGTDTALMLLNGIAQKVKFKALQDRAREKIADIAEARELTTEELEDRLAPDLGLDEQGSLLLDFGPRQFRVGFDETLKPYVRDLEGTRLPDLPKPKKTDDEALAGAAVERFKLLKKDARTIAAQQVLRLDMAMCTRRRWTPQVFVSFMAEHPLVRHLVQRIVWGAYRVPAGASYGGELLACFRATPDGAFTDAADDAFEVPAGDDIRIGIPHALDLPAADAAAFGQLFADYELMQPFVQIGRDTHALSSAEMAGKELTRWVGSKVPTGRVLGLVNKGWRRGPAEDAGGINYFTKALGPDRVIVLQLDPGICVGMVDEEPEQTLCEIVTGRPGRWGGTDMNEAMSTLDPIAASELIRDMEALRA